MWLFFITLFLVGIGVIMVFSASYYDTLSSDPFEYLKRQGSFAAAGVVVMLIAMNFDYQRYRYLYKPLLIFTFVLLVVVFAFEDTKGAHRWIPLGVINLQPSEIAKFTLAVFLAVSLSRRDADPNVLGGDLGRILLVLGFALGAIVVEPDLGTTLCLAGTALVVLIAAGLKWSYAAAATVLGGGGVVFMVMNSEYQMERIMGWLDPWGDPTGKGYQLINSLYALGSGGFWGMGVSNGRQKLGFLPEQNTDFIFSIIGEELGFIGAGFIILLFLFMAWRGYRIALNAPDLYGSLLAVGITTSLVLQAALNLGVVTGCLPVTGIALPFLSYGGSSLLMSMGSVGVLLNISRYRK
jgi:cell division protein FtsW